MGIDLFFFVIKKKKGGRGRGRPKFTGRTMKFILDHQLTITGLNPATKQYLKCRLEMQNLAHREEEWAGRFTRECPWANRLEMIERAMMRRSELLDMMVLDQRKAHVWVQKHAVRRDVFVTLNSKLQIKAHAMMTTAYSKQNSDRRVTAGVKSRFCNSLATGWNGVMFNPHEKCLEPLSIKGTNHFFIESRCYYYQMISEKRYGWMGERPAIGLW